MVLPIGDYQPTANRPWVTWLLIALNVIAYGIQLEEGQAFTNTYAVTPYEVMNGRDLTGPAQKMLVQGPDGQMMVINVQSNPVFNSPDFEHQPAILPLWTTLITAMFLHGSPLHLLGNMLFLWIFGDNVEDTLGWLEYLLLYLLSGIVGFLAQSMASPESVIPVLGASGAVAGVMGAYLLLFPLNAIRVLIFYFPADLPAYVVIGLWIVSQFVLGVLELDRLGKTGGVAYLAHIGGVAMGMLATYLLVPERESSVGS
jgi:membrane associated rhomboid family serine protease